MSTPVKKPEELNALAAQIVLYNPAFREVTRAALDRLVQAAQFFRRRRGEIVYRKGELWNYLGFVSDGSLAMVTSAGGKRAHLYDHIKTGQFFGVSAALDGDPEMADTAIISRQATYVCFPRGSVLDLCRIDASLSLALASIVAKRLRHVTALLAEQVGLSVDQRVARFLLEFAGAPGMAAALDPLPSMTQAEIAAGAGTVKEVAARIIGRLEAFQALRRERGHICWLDRARLEMAVKQ